MVDAANILTNLQKLQADQVPHVVVTLVGVRGSAPQVQGAKAIVGEAGLICGTVGGGKIEAKAIQLAQEYLSSKNKKSCDLVVWNLQRDIGMTCGGEVQLFFEIYDLSLWTIVLFGAGHVVQAVVPMLLLLPCRIICVDPRHEWLDKLPENPRLKRLHHPHPPSVVESLDPTSYFLLMTQGHSTDLPILVEVLQRFDPPYVGVLGSLQKAKILRRDLQNSGLSDEKIQSFFCPLGLPIGNNTPAEIAISVCAQILQIKRGVKF
jgi:xanthine dehydrogenase accessory factor